MPFKDVRLTRTLANKRGRKLIEKDIEAYLVKFCNSLHWLCEKYSSPQKRSVPDRLVMLPDSDNYPTGLFCFIELKRPGGESTVAQRLDHFARRRMGHLVMVCDSYEEVDVAIAIIKFTEENCEIPELPQFLLT